MENCLANTGSDTLIHVVCAACLIAASLFVFRSHRKAYHLTFLFVALSFMGLFQVAFAKTAAAASSSVCQSNTSLPDATSGNAGQVQSVNVTLNDKPSNGAQFVLDSLILQLKNGGVAGSTLSGDQKTVVAPGEGVYVAGANGVVTFTPEPAFSGTAHGVIYALQDSAGHTITNSYTPTVTATNASCVDPGSETRVLADITLGYVNGVPDYVFDDFIGTSTNSPPLLPEDVDLDPVTPGVQTTLSKPSEGWSAEYNTATDQLTIRVDNWVDFYTKVGTGSLFGYTVRPVLYCNSPAAGNIYVIIVG